MSCRRYPHPGNGSSSGRRGTPSATPLRQIAIIAPLTLLSLVPLAPSGCSSSGGGLSWGEEQRWDDSVVPLDVSADAFSLANQYILTTRPQGTEVLLGQLSEVLAEREMVGVASELDVDPAASPTIDLSDQTCPTPDTLLTNPSIDCRGIAFLAAEFALGASGPIEGRLRGDIRARYGQSLREDDLAFVSSWASEALRSGIRTGAIQAVQPLRRMGICDQEPSAQQRSFLLGVARGMALIDEAEGEVLPTVPRTTCNTDAMAQTVLAQATSNARRATPICRPETAEDVFTQVALANQHEQWQAGVDQGLREGFELLRVRLVGEWECEKPPAPPEDSCQCYARNSGGGPVYCFPRGTFDRPPTYGGELADKARETPQCQPADPTAIPKPVGSPLVVDLDGDGVRLSGDRLVSIDLADTGERVRIAALTGQDAFLTLDVDGDGEITSGAELFGNSTSCTDGRRCADGVEALSQHDDGDGVLDRRDPVFGRLRLWRDEDGDGVGVESELEPLASARIERVLLAPRLDMAWADERGNAAMRAVVFTTADGDRGAIHDVWFALTFGATPRDLRTAGLVASGVW